MKSMNAVRTEMHSAQVREYQLPMIPNRWANMAGCG